MNDPSKGGGHGWNSAAARRKRSDHAMAIRARRLRCLALPAPSEAELERMVADFLARRGGVTRCLTVCVLPVQNGDGPGGHVTAAVAAPTAAAERGQVPNGLEPPS